MTPAYDGNRRLLNRTGAAFAGGVLVIFAGALWALVYHDLPEKNHDIILILVNTVANVLLMIAGYFFGASVATARQGEIIATQASTIKSAQDKLAPVAGVPDSTVVLPPGDTVAVKAEDPKP